MVSIKKIRSSVTTGIATGLIGFGGGFLVNNKETSVYPIKQDSLSVIFTHPGDYLKMGFLSGQKAIVRMINNAKSTVHVQAYNFTDPEIANALIKAKSRGVKVMMLLDKENEKRVSDALQKIIDTKTIPVKIHRVPGIAHSKIVIADGGTEDAVMYTGSFNLSKSANTRNVENLLIIKSPEITAKYLKDWEACWDQGCKIGENKSLRQKTRDDSRTLPEQEIKIAPDRNTDTIVSAMKAIQGAEHYLWISVTSDKISDYVIDIIENAQSKRADVRVLVDGKNLGKGRVNLVESLQNKGIRVKVGDVKNNMIVCDDAVVIKSKDYSFDPSSSDVFYKKSDAIEKSKKSFINRWNEKKQQGKKQKHSMYHRARGAGTVFKKFAKRNR